MAELYDVETRTLNQAVRRNLKRFPEDFMFQMNDREMTIWISQFVISNRETMGLRKRPLVFTEQGIAMLSSVLKSERAIQVNIQIMRTFTKLREMLASNKELRQKIEELEKTYDQRFKVVFKAIQKPLLAENRPRQNIGFRT